MPGHREKPADILLDLLRGAKHEGRRTAQLIESAALFGIQENTVRVTLSRLNSRGLVVSPSRGRYRLAEAADPINVFVERWREGENRIRPWEHRQWLLCHPGSDDDRTAWSLDALGFRRVRGEILGAA